MDEPIPTSPEPGARPAATCTAHPTALAVGTCFSCLRPICQACTVLEGVGVACPACVARERRRRKGRTALVVGVVVALAGSSLAVVLGGGGAGGAGGASGARGAAPPDAAPAARPVEFDHRRYGSRASDVLKLRAHLAKEPCDARKVEEYGDLLLDVREYREAAGVASAYADRCPADVDVLRVAFAAHDALLERERAVEVASRLIELEPDAHDYWWWRGTALAGLKRHELAAADFLQTIALANDIRNIPFNLADEYVVTGRHCDAYVAVERTIDLRPSLADEEEIQRRQLKALVRGEGCRGVAGQGRAALGFPRGGPPLIRARARIGGESVEAIVDPGTAYVTLGRALADRLGVQAATEVRLNLMGALTPARLGRVADLALEGTRARDVEVAVVDAVPGGVEALVGLSYLWRFTVALDSGAGRLEIAPRKARRYEP